MGCPVCKHKMQTDLCLSKLSLSFSALYSFCTCKWFMKSQGLRQKPPACFICIKRLVGGPGLVRLRPDDITVSFRANWKLPRSLEDSKQWFLMEAMAFNCLKEKTTSFALTNSGATKNWRCNCCHGSLAIQFIFQCSWAEKCNSLIFSSFINLWEGTLVSPILSSKSKKKNIPDLWALRTHTMCMHVHNFLERITWTITTHSLLTFNIWFLVFTHYCTKLAAPTIICAFYSCLSNICLKKNYIDLLKEIGYYFKNN